MLPKPLTSSSDSRFQAIFQATQYSRSSQLEPYGSPGNSRIILGSHRKIFEKYGAMKTAKIPMEIFLYNELVVGMRSNRI